MMVVNHLTPLWSAGDDGDDDDDDDERWRGWPPLERNSKSSLLASPPTSSTPEQQELLESYTTDDLGWLLSWLPLLWLALSIDRRGDETSYPSLPELAWKWLSVGRFSTAQQHGRRGRRRGQRGRQDKPEGKGFSVCPIDVNRLFCVLCVHLLCRMMFGIYRAPLECDLRVPSLRGH